MKILLIHPPWMRFFGSCLNFPPMPLNYIAASVAKNLPEIEIEVYNSDYSEDSSAAPANDIFTKEHHKYVSRLNDKHDVIWSEIETVISEYSPDMVGVSAMSATFPSAQKVLEIAKKVNNKIVTVLGGRHSTALPELSLKNSKADFVVIGDGEETFIDLLNNLESPQKVNGIAFLNEKRQVIKTPPRIRQIQIDDYPMPIFESKISKYGFEDKSKSDIFTWSILTARGCPFQCVYCATEHKVRFRSVENVMLEIRTMKEKYGVTHFCFEDDTFSLKKDRLIELCQALAQENVKWTCVTRIDTIDDEIVKIMKDSGCTQVFLGIETGSPETLKRIRKNINLQQVRKALKIFKKFKLLAMGFFIIGFHWEKFSDMKKTVALIENLPLDSFQLNFATPLPDTALFKELEKSGKLKPEEIDWTNFHQGSLNMNFSNYSQEKWEKMLLYLQAKSIKILRKKYIKVILKRFLSEPQVILKKIISRIKVILNFYKSSTTNQKSPEHE